MLQIDGVRKGERRSNRWALSTDTDTATQIPIQIENQTDRQ